MAQYTYANHPNNVEVRNWCNDNKGRGSSLSEKLFSYMKHPKSGIAKYKCGEQLIDDVMLENARVIMREIEALEKSGKRKIHEKKLKGPTLVTNKHENYSEIESSKEYKDYVEFHRKYYTHSKLFREQLGLILPTQAKASNLMSAKFKQKINNAKQLVITLKLAPCTDKGERDKVRKENGRIPLIREAAKNLKKTVEKYMTPKEEFFSIVEDINSDEKLSKLVPVILMMNFSDAKDFDQVENLYSRFTSTSSAVSVVKLVNIKACHKKALEMIADGWLDEEEFDLAS